MIVVSDTSVICNLFLVGQIDLLPALFQSVIIPPKVKAELLELNNFGFDITQVLGADFIEVKTPTDQSLIKKLQLDLDEGEAQAITLALELKADLLLIDELKGRAVAEKLGLDITGILGILLRSKSAGHIKKVKPTLDDLVNKANFFISQNLFNSILRKAGE